MFPETIETDRLRLRRLSRETVDPLDLYRICSADDGIEAVTEHLTWDPHRTPNETREFLVRAETGWEEADAAEYAVFPREGEDGAEEFAGCTGLHLDWEKRTGTLGVWFRRRFWGRGYSGERAAALFELAFDRLGLDLVAVVHYPGNENSERAIERYVERFGGRREGRLRNWHAIDGDPRDAVRYTVSREEWRDAVDGGDSPTVRFVDQSA